MSLRARHLALLALCALALRAPLLLLSPGAPFDMESYARAAGVNGPGLYSLAGLDGRYPYLPLWWLLLRGLGWLQGAFGGEAGLWQRLPGVFGDVAISLLLYQLVERRQRSGATLSPGKGGLGSAQAGLLAGLSWALNPLAILISAGHGQFDSLALALLLLAAWLLEYEEGPDAELKAALALAAAWALKTWPLAFLPLYLGAFPSLRERLRFSAWVVLPPLLLLLPWLFLDSPEAVVQRLSYSGSTAMGLSGALRAGFFAVAAPVELYRQADLGWRALSLGLLALGFLWSLWRARRLHLLDGLAFVAMTLLLAAPGLAPQYLIWPAALALLQRPSLGWRLTLWCLPLALIFYALWMPVVLAGAAAWSPPELKPWAVLLWGGVNLLWWAGMALEWDRQREHLLRPQRGRLHY